MALVGVVSVVVTVCVIVSGMVKSSIRRHSSRSNPGIPDVVSFAVCNHPRAWRR